MMDQWPSKQQTLGHGVWYLLEGQCGLVPVLVPEVVVHAKVSLPPQLVPRLAVGDALDHATLQSIKTHQSNMN